MSKYEILWNYVKSQDKEVLELSFEKVASILGFEIDHSFLTYKKELTEYGYSVSKISMKEKKVKFRKS